MTTWKAHHTRGKTNPIFSLTITQILICIYSRRWCLPKSYTFSTLQLVMLFWTSLKNWWTKMRCRMTWRWVFKLLSRRCSISMRVKWVSRISNLRLCWSYHSVSRINTTLEWLSSYLHRHGSGLSLGSR